MVDRAGTADGIVSLHAVQRLARTIRAERLARAAHDRRGEDEDRGLVRVVLERTVPTGHPSSSGGPP